MDGKSLKCVSLGVKEDYKAYEPIKGKLIINRDVVFDESKSWVRKKDKQASLEESNALVNDESGGKPQENLGVVEDVAEYYDLFDSYANEESHKEVENQSKERNIESSVPP